MQLHEWRREHSPNSLGQRRSHHATVGGRRFVECSRKRGITGKSIPPMLSVRQILILMCHDLDVENIQA